MSRYELILSTSNLFVSTNIHRKHTRAQFGSHGLPQPHGVSFPAISNTCYYSFPAPAAAVRSPHDEDALGLHHLLVLGAEAAHGAPRSEPRSLLTRSPSVIITANTCMFQTVAAAILSSVPTSSGRPRPRHGSCHGDTRTIRYPIVLHIYSDYSHLNSLYENIFFIFHHLHSSSLMCRVY